MFAYYYNNPVALRDPAGTIPCDDGFYDETYRQIGEWLGWRLKDAIDSFVTYMTNDSPDVVKSDLESKGVAAYKGSFVFRVDWLDTIELPDYDGDGMDVIWENNAEFRLDVFKRETSITANKEGLISLAKQMLYMAYSNLPKGSHVHYDDFFTKSGSDNCLIIVKE